LLLDFPAGFEVDGVLGFVVVVVGAVTGVAGAFRDDVPPRSARALAPPVDPLPFGC